MPEVWVPGMEGPHEDFVASLLRQIERFTERMGIERAFVEVELEGGSRFALESISPEPGFGFVTLRPHVAEGEIDDLPAELVVPLGVIRRIELDTADDHRARFGFSLPEQP